MSWTIERRGRVAVVTMRTNTVNAQNRAFFADLHEAFDRLETRPPRFPGRADRHRHPVLRRPRPRRALPALRRGPGRGRVLVPGLPGDEHAAVHLPAPDRGRGQRARVRRWPDHRRRLRPPRRRGRRRRGSASTRCRSGSRCPRSTCGCSPTPGVSRSRPAPACSGRSSPPHRRTRWAWCTNSHPLEAAAGPRGRHRRADPRGLPRAVRLHQARLPGRRPARHRRPGRPARPAELPAGMTSERPGTPTAATGSSSRAAPPPW